MNPTPIIPEVPARLAWNEKLAATFGLKPEYPAVTQQLEVVPFNRMALKPFGYNPSICRWGNRLLMAYRYHPTVDWKTKLAMAELNEKFHVTTHKDIVIPGMASMEDPHLFVHQDTLWMSWVESPSWDRCVMKYGPLKEDEAWEAPTRFQPKHGQNDGTAMEKNWAFHTTFAQPQTPPQANQISAWYSDTTILRLDGDAIQKVITLPAFHFPWGQPKGGWQGEAVRFFHSALDNENNPHAVNNPTRRYYIGCFKNGEISKLPILYGSEADDLSATEAASCRHRKANVVFCSGAVTMPDGSWVISVGINDCQTALLRVTENDLHL
jgi:hypothetical protein